MSNILNKINKMQNIRHYQHGAVLLVMLVILVLGATAMLLNSLNSTTARLAREKITADALAQAKEALIGYAVSVKVTNSSATLNEPRPGDLPCPDTNDDGLKENSCGSADGSSGQSNRLGRLPWKTLGLSDLRDGNGERLWYAVSNNFKEHWNTLTPLNSDTVGTITVRASDGSVLYDSTSSGGAVAIIISPGNALQRQGAASLQNRNCTIGVNCNASEICTTNPTSLTPKCDPVNYLDIANGEDNANFIDSAINGFIHGQIKDANDRVILNDQILVITQVNIMQSIQNRVAAEVKNCLDNYASLNNGRYPWAVSLNDFTYFDQTNLLFGRIPDDMTNSRISSGNVMAMQWGSTCTTHSANTASTWWKQWREMVFYGLADAYKPISPPSTTPTCTPAGACLVVNPTSSVANNKYVVIVAGKMIDTQVRSSVSDKSNLNNYLETPNNTGATTFSQNAPSTTFNDTVVYKQ